MLGPGEGVGGWGLGDGLQHDDGDGEGGFGLHAVAALHLVADDAAALGDVPGRALVLVRGIDGVGRGLDVQGHSPERGEGDVEDEREDGIEDVQEPEGEFNEVEEHAYNADIHVVVCVSTWALAPSSHGFQCYASIIVFGRCSPETRYVWYRGI